MAAKNIEELSYDDLLAYGRQLYGFEIDELKSTYKTESELREFLVSTRSVRGIVATKDDLAWDSELPTELDDDGLRTVAELKESDALHLKKSIDDSKSGVTPADIKQAFKNLLNDDDEDDE